VQTPEALASVGKEILDLQLLGMLLGGLVFGVLGDRLGRLKTLFGSILLYSLANLANAYVGSVGAYRVLRFVAGFGLAGELGAGITLVSELLPQGVRGLGTTLVASVGLLGAIAAGAAADALSWSHCYLLGGLLGLALLALRVGVVESSLFRSSKAQGVSHGNPLQLLWPPERLGRFLLVVLAGMPIWYVGGVLFVFAPELGRALGLVETIAPSKVIFWAYVGVALGDVSSGLLSQRLRSRVAVIRLFQAGLVASILGFLALAAYGAVWFYGAIAVVGFATGYWAVFVTVAAEQFGTNLRATAATSAPNFVRATAVPIVALWFRWKPSLGTLPATVLLGMLCCTIGLVASFCLKDTFARELDWVER
jgi:MFS family permease